MNIIFIICSIVIIAAVVWNVVALHNLGKTKLDEKYYWELKWGYQFLVGLFTVVVAVFAFLGWNSTRELKNDIKEKIDKQINEIIDARFGDKVKKLNRDIGKTRAENRKNENILIDLSRQATMLNDGMNRMSERVSQRFYIIQNLKINTDEGKIFFKDLKTIKGKPLPKFRNIPCVFIRDNAFVPQTGIVDITAEYIQLSYSDRSRILDILIIEET